MTTKDLKNAKIATICRILAKAMSDVNNSLNMSDVMRFVNCSTNDDIRELIRLHKRLDERDEVKEFIKETECNNAWRSYTRPRRVRRPRGLNTHQEMCYHLGIKETWEELWQDYAKAEAKLVNESNNKLEEEIAIWDWLGSLEDGQYTDNHIAYQTAYEIAEANAKREHMLSKIACDAVKKHVYYGTIVRFMNEMCKDDKERAFFLQEYSNAQWRDGRFN